MKLRLTILSAAAITLAACDGEKVQEAKKEGAEAVKAAGEAAKEVTAKGMEKAKEITKTAGEKLKSATESAKEAVVAKGGPALESFKAKIGDLSEWFKGAEGKAGGDPVKANQMMGEVMARVKGISGEGLPPDLKSALERYQNAMTGLQEVSKTMPTDTAGAEAWYRDNGAKLTALGEEVQAAQKGLQAAAANHGLPNLDLGGEKPKSE